MKIERPARKARKTLQKQVIQNAISRLNNFFSAEELHKEVQKHNSGIGIATVYRFLNDAQKSHSLHAYTCGRKTTYTKDSRSHCHFTCEKCGTVEHFNVANLNFIKKDFEGEICHFQIDVFGICKKCNETPEARFAPAKGNL